MTELSHEEIQRYSRQLVLPEVGPAGQARLRAARVLCIGAGGLGSPLTLYLAAAGVGTLGIVEDDAVDVSNLHRQILFESADVGRSKLDAARERLARLNPHVTIVSHAERFSAANAEALVAQYDVVADGCDNFATRFLVNDTCVRAGKPDVHASVFRFEGQLSVFACGTGPCYRCLFPEPPPAELVPSCAEGGVLGVLPAILGSLQALEVIKLLIGQGEVLAGRLLLFDGLAGRFTELAVARDPKCPACGDHPKPLQAVPATDGAAESIADAAIPAVSVEDYAAARKAGSAPRLIDVREATELALAAIDGALHIPLVELPARLGELDPAQPYVLSCQKGGRSRKAWRMLHAAGFGDIRVLDGGIDAWAARIDPRMPRY